MEEEIENLINTYQEDEDLINGEHDFKKTKTGYSLKFPVDTVEKTYEITIEFQKGDKEKYNITEKPEDSKETKTSIEYKTIIECIKVLMKKFKEKREKFMNEVSF
jgi:hypothetical protein